MSSGLRWGAFVTALGIVGCSPTFRATYDTTTVRRASGPRLDVALDLAVLRDARRQHAASTVLFRGEREVEVDGEDSCVNAEASYEAGIARQVTDTVALHLSRRGVLRAVTVESAARADYRLSGEIGALYGVQDTSGQAQAGAAVGGLIGGLIAATASAPARVHIVFQNLAIHDSTGRIVARPADVVLDFRGELSADAYCHSVYTNVNDKLREAVHQLAANVEGALWQATSGHGQESRAQSPPPPGDAELAALEAERRAQREAMRQSALSSWETDHETWEREVAQTEDARAPLTTWMWVAAGAGAALVGTGVYFELEAHAAHDDAQSEARLWNMTASAAQRAELEARIAESESDRDTFATLGAVFLAGGGASLATSLVLLVMRPDLPEEPVRPVVGRDELGLIVRGSF